MVLGVTPAEFVTLRESCGLNVNEAAEWLGVNLRTIRRWSDGDQRVPPGVAAQLIKLDGQLTTAADGAAIQMQHAIAHHGRAPDDLALVRYATIEDLARYRPDMAELPLSVHGALIDRVRLAAERLGITCRIVWMNRESYESWRGARRDTESTRAEWAVEQITAENPPHK